MPFTILPLEGGRGLQSESSIARQRSSGTTWGYIDVNFLTDSVIPVSAQTASTPGSVIKLPLALYVHIYIRLPVADAGINSNGGFRLQICITCRILIYLYSKGLSIAVRKDAESKKVSARPKVGQGGSYLRYNSLLWCGGSTDVS